MLARLASHWLPMEISQAQARFFAKRARLLVDVRVLGDARQQARGLLCRELAPGQVVAQDKAESACPKFGIWHEFTCCFCVGGFNISRSMLNVNGNYSH